jgi:prepilin-type N-terminal cleavage/methylation domain-containing protein
MSRTEAGLTLVELLVTMALISLVLGAAGGLVAVARPSIEQENVRIETTQALRATLDTLARDLRLGGACLPTNGAFVALSGSDAGVTDRIVTRHGLVQSDLTCVRTALRTDLLANGTDLAVDTAGGFAAGMWIYIRHPNGTGEFLTITGAQAAARTLQKSTTLSKDYPISSGVYAIDERTYATDTSDSTKPTFTVATNGGPALPFASGVEELDIQYQLARNCPACDVVDLPVNDGEWMLVTEIDVGVTVRSRVADAQGRFFRRTGRIKAKPRNLLPPG